MTPHFILTTAGHVDHGKSSLVRALTGVDPDRLPEERARGITIDLGFARLELHGPGPEPVTYDLGLVDVPGHEDFVKNMVAGVGAIDLALLVVAADDGWMPQTEEHLQILTYLGVTRAVVALSKMDLAVGGEAACVAMIREQLRGSRFSEAPIVPTSVATERGLKELRMALTGVLATTPPRPDLGKPRLPIDRVFALRGIGTVVTGTLAGGSFSRGQLVVVQPGGLATRIRAIQSHNRDLESAGPGMRTALNLADVSPRGRDARAGGSVGRGDVVTLAGLGEAYGACDVWLEKSARLFGRDSRSGRSLRDGGWVRFHAGSTSVPGRVLLADRKELEPGEQCVAQLRLHAPVFLSAGDHFVLRDASGVATLAGGTVLEPRANRRGFRKPAYQESLRVQAQAPGDLASIVVAQIGREFVAPRKTFLARSSFSSAQIAGALEQLSAAGQIVLTGDWVLDARLWDALRRKAGDTIEAHHKAHPEQPGLPLPILRAAVEKELRVPELFEALVNALLAKPAAGTGAPFVQVGAAIKRAAHQAALPPHLGPAGAKIRSALGAKPMDPPSRKELAPDSSGREALRFLLETGEATEVGPEVVLLSAAYARAKEIVLQFLGSRGAGTVSELRQALGTSRRVVVPLLEKLDREGLTKREGDYRRLAGRP